MSSLISRQHSTKGYPGSVSGGFTLIEVLIALLVIMGGVLGVAAMQLVSYQNNQGAYYRSQATFIAAETLDRMRANPEGYTTYAGFNTGSSTVPSDPGCAGNTNGCNASQSAAMDLRVLAGHFPAQVSGAQDPNEIYTLPNGRATITRDSGNVFTVQVSWSEKLWDDTANSDGSTQRSLVGQSVSLSTTLN